jgi:hypothetical protein
MKRAVFTFVGEQSAHEALVKQGAQPLYAKSIDWGELSEQMDQHIIGKQTS